MFINIQLFQHYTKFVTYYSQYYANIIGSGLVFEAGGVVGAIPRNIYVSYLFVTAYQKLRSYSLFGFLKVLNT